MLTVQFIDTLAMIGSWFAVAASSSTFLHYRVRSIQHHRLADVEAITAGPGPHFDFSYGVDERHLELKTRIGLVDSLAESFYNYNVSLGDDVESSAGYDEDDEHHA